MRTMNENIKLSGTRLILILKTSTCLILILQKANHIKNIDDWITVIILTRPTSESHFYTCMVSLTITFLNMR